MKPLDMRDAAIIRAFPAGDYERTVLDVGCGAGRLLYHLASLGFRVYGVDTKKYETWKNSEYLTFRQGNIFDLSSIPVKEVSVVICGQVLEHLKGWKTALVQLLALAQLRLIITVPFKRSFYNPEHCNFWDDESIKDFVKFCKPYLVSISKTITKPADVELGWFDYVIVIDKGEVKNESI